MKADNPASTIFPKITTANGSSVPYRDGAALRYQMSEIPQESEDIDADAPDLFDWRCWDICWHECSFCAAGY